MISFVLEVIALPNAISLIRPNFILMMIIFWAYMPYAHFHIIYAWGIGLLVDILLGSLLGQYALIFTICAFITKKSYVFLKERNLFQQTLCLMGCFYVQALLIAWINGMLNYPSPYGKLLFIPALLSTLLWPLFFNMMRNCCILLGMDTK
ncbi:rod shape-determining protein MreD [Gammaproteobacteria bacterium]|nr:rod shape-determining protein MreD [Gammaproteobacteria bacterium]